MNDFEFGNYIYEKYMDNLNAITLTEQDQLISYLYVNRIISPTQMSNIVNELCNQERYLETNNILKINTEEKPCIEENTDIACEKCFLARKEILKQSIKNVLSTENITMDEILFMDNELLRFKEEYDHFRTQSGNKNLTHFGAEYQEMDNLIMNKENQALKENKIFLNNISVYQSLIQREKSHKKQLETSSFAM